MPQASSKLSAFLTHPLVRGTVVAGAVAGTVLALAAAYYPIRRYASHVVSTQAVTSSVSIDLAHLPAGMAPELSGLLLDEARRFAGETTADPITGKSIKNFTRLQDPLDRTVLADLAGAYQAHMDQRSNAWIKNIVAIHRAYDRHQNQQKITIEAQYRTAAALVERGDLLYLVDDEGVRLPGEMTAAQCAALQSRRVLPLVAIRGSAAALPAPGQAFAAADFAAGMQLLTILAAQPYARQITGVNVANYDGRVDKMAPQITLDTTFGTSVWWGRPAHDETFYEVSLPAKLKTLTRIALRYARIDAAHRYVDIRFEQPRVPVPEPAITQDSRPPATAPRHG